MNAPVPKSSGIVLAGGSSRRMGRNKLMLPWKDGTLLTNAVRCLKPHVDDLWIVGDSSMSADNLETGMGYIPDNAGFEPLNGIYLGLKICRHDIAFVIAADLPMISSREIESIYRAATGFDITIIQTDDGYHPLFGIYSRACLQPMSIQIQGGNRKVMGFWDQMKTNIVDVGPDKQWKKALFNINSPKDYRYAVALLHHSHFRK